MRKVEVTEENGSTHLATVILDDLSGKGTVVISALKSKPLGLRVDPNQKLLFRYNFAD